MKTPLTKTPVLKLTIPDVPEEEATLRLTEIPDLPEDEVTLHLTENPDDLQDDVALRVDCAALSALIDERERAARGSEPESVPFSCRLVFDEDGTSVRDEKIKLAPRNQLRKTTKPKTKGAPK